MFVLDGHTERLSDSCLAFSPDGSLLASGGADNTVRLWDLASRKQVAALTGHTNLVTRVLFFDGGRKLASGSWDGSVRFWSIPSGRRAGKTWQLGEFVNAGAVSPDGKTLAAGGGTWHGPLNRVRLLDLESHAEVGAVGEHEKPIGGILFSPDGRWLLTGSADGTARLWQLPAGKPGPVLRFRAWIQGEAFSPDGRLVAVAAGRLVRVFEAQTGAVRETFTGHYKTLSSVAYSPDGRLLLSAAKDGSVRCWDMQTWKLRNVFRWKLGPAAHAVCFAPDGLTAAAGGANGKIVVWDVDED